MEIYYSTKFTNRADTQRESEEDPKLGQKLPKLKDK